MDDPTTPGFTLSAGWLSFDARRQHDSPAEGFTLGGGGQLTFRSLDLVQARVEASGAVRQYLGRSLPLYSFGGFEIALDKAAPQPRVEVEAGLGHGRFYNVTPLAKAIQIEAVLIARGVIPAALAEDVLLAVAVAIGEEGTAAERAEHVVALIEQALSDQDLPRKLDAATGLAIEQIIAQTGRERHCGWTAQAGIAYEIFDPKGGPRDLLISLALDAAVATDANSQLLLRSKVAGPYWITDQYTLVLEVTFETRLDDVITFSTRYSLFQDKPRGQLPAGTQSALFQLEMSWGWVGVSLQMEFAKVAEAPAWKQSIIISSTAYLW